MSSHDSHMIKMAVIVTQFWKCFRHSISTRVRVKVWKCSSTLVYMCGILEPHQNLPCFSHVSVIESKGEIGGPLGLGTGKEKQWELSFQTLILRPIYIVLSSYLYLQRRSWSITTQARPLRQRATLRRTFFHVTLTTYILRTSQWHHVDLRPSIACAHVQIRGNLARYVHVRNFT